MNSSLLDIIIIGCAFVLIYKGIQWIDLSSSEIETNNVINSRIHNRGNMIMGNTHGTVNMSNNISSTMNNVMSNMNCNITSTMNNMQRNIDQAMSEMNRSIADSIENIKNENIPNGYDISIDIVKCGIQSKDNFSSTNNLVIFGSACTSTNNNQTTISKNNNNMIYFNQNGTYYRISLLNGIVEISQF